MSDDAHQIDPYGRFTFFGVDDGHGELVEFMATSITRNRKSSRMTVEFQPTVEVLAQQIDVIRDLRDGLSAPSPATFETLTESLILLESERKKYDA